MAPKPQLSAYDAETSPILSDDIGSTWTPLFYKDECTFSHENFSQVMNNLIRNPNIDSNHLFRADIIHDVPFESSQKLDPSPKIAQFDGFNLDRVMYRKFIPRKPELDKSINQTCLLLSSRDGTETKSLVIYLPDIASPEEAPHYHPAVQGIAFLYTTPNSASCVPQPPSNPNSTAQTALEAPKTPSSNPPPPSGHLSIHFSFFPSLPPSSAPTLTRTAHHLLTTVLKHSLGLSTGYTKKVHHDLILPQTATQNTYSRLKTTYAKRLIEGWVEVTDASKHVFEDLGIAAFLIELWRVMYGGTPGCERENEEAGEQKFPGFVDIGCGNGLLTYVLRQEGYVGWGFDARKRKSWGVYAKDDPEMLKELVLIPEIIRTASSSKSAETESGRKEVGTHNGIFPPGTFIISNHADELTPWTSLLGLINESPFIAIPCCSHNLTGARFRAPPPPASLASAEPKKKGGKPPPQPSAYSSLVSWVTALGESAGWVMESEQLRIPSTRKTCLLGRTRSKPYGDVDIQALIQEYGGAAGWEENALKLVKGGPRGH